MDTITVTVEQVIDTQCGKKEYQITVQYRDSITHVRLVPRWVFYGFQWFMEPIEGPELPPGIHSALNNYAARQSQMEGITRKSNACTKDTVQNMKAV